MEQKMDKYGNLTISLFDINTQDKEYPEIIHHEENGLTHIEVHPQDILSNVEIIKKILAAENITIVVEDENE